MLKKQKYPPKVFFEKRCSQNFRKIHGKTLEPEHLFIKIETLAQVFSYEFCKIPQNIFFTENVWVTASEKCL